MAKIYIICPVRHLDKYPGLKERIMEYAERLQARGHQVRVPFNHTNQEDLIGIRITDEHERIDILGSEEFHIIWVPGSEGLWYDWAQAIARQYYETRRPSIYFIHPETMQLIPEHQRPEPKLLGSEECLWQNAKDQIGLIWEQNPHTGLIAPNCLWLLAQARIIARRLKIPIVVYGVERAITTPNKSYNNVLWCTHLNLPAAVSRAEFDQAVAKYLEKHKSA